MARYHEETRLTPEVFRNVAADLRDIANEYEDLATKLERQQIPAVHVESYKSLLRGLKEFEGHLDKSFTAYNRTRRRTPDPDETKPPGERSQPQPAILYAAESDAATADKEP